MDTLLFVYNQFYYNFASDVLDASDADEQSKAKLTDIVESRAKHSSTTARHVDRFLKHDKIEDVFVLLSKPIDSATASTAILEDAAITTLSPLKKLTVSDLVKMTPSQHHATLVSYLYIFVLLAYVYVRTDVNDDDSDDSDSDDEETRKQAPDRAQLDVVLEALRAVQGGGDHSEYTAKITDTTTKALIDNISKVIVKKKHTDDEPGVAPSMLENTKIGNLAKEISEEIDISSLNIEKPEDLLNMGQNGMLGNIISKVGQKIHQKMEKGELKHEDLMGEAVSMLGMLGMGGKGAGAAGGANPLAGMLNNPMLKNVMKNMGGMDGLANLASMMSNSDKAKSSAVKDRLRKKLEKRKH